MTNPTFADCRFYQGGQPVLAALDADVKYASFSGSPATLETCELTHLERERVNGCLPIGFAASPQIQLEVKQSLAGPPVR